MISRLFALCCLSAMTVSASGQDVMVVYRASELLSICESSATSDIARCQGFVIGVTDTLSDPDMSKVPICFPKGVNVNQMVAIVTKFMRDNPAHLHVSAAATTAIALRLSFPCKTR